MRPFYFAAIIVTIVISVALTLVIMKMNTTNVSSITRTAGSSSEIDSLQRIDVRAAPITVPLPGPYSGTITGFHLALVYVNATGGEFVCEGLPFDPTTGKAPPDSVLISNPQGLVTRGYCYPYNFGFDARSSSSSEVQSITIVRSSKEASQIYDCLVKKTVAFNAANVPYYMATGPNSNSFVRTLLEYCKMPIAKPLGATVTPGWDLVINLEEKT